MFERQKSGSVVCPSCGKLVGVGQEKCPYCGRAFPGMLGFTKMFRNLGEDMGFVPMIMWGCGILYLLTLIVQPDEIFAGGLLNMLSPSGEALYVFGASGAFPVFGGGRWWTLLSAAWLHGSVLHIVFNMMWVRDMGRTVAETYGPGRMMLIYTISAVSGALLSSSVAYFLPWLPGPLGGASMTVGASGALFGLFGALYYYGNRTGSSQLNQQIKNFLIIMVIFGFLVPRVDNWGHLGGFLGGYLISRFWLDPLKPERIDHIIGAFVCVLLSVAAVVASVLHGLPQLREWGLLQ